MALDLLKWNKITGEWEIPVAAVDFIDSSYLEIKTVNGSSLFGTGNLVVSGADATKLAILNNLSDLNNAATARTNIGLSTTANQTDSSNKRFVTDAQQTVIGNTSGTNTGDNAVNSLYSGLAASKQDTLVSATNIKTINGSSVLGSGNLVVSGATNITQVEVDFGTTPVAEATFTIADANATFTGTKIIATLAYNAPTGKDLDEVEMDDLIIKCGNSTVGFFEMFIRSVDGSYLEGKFKINYIIA